MRRPARVCAIIVLITTAIEIAGLGVARAQPEGLGEKIIATGADLEIEILPSDAAFTSEIRLVVPSFGTFFIGTNQEAGQVVHVGVVPAGLELIFEIFVQETGDTFRTGPGERNPDDLPHATVVALGPSTWNVGFEDQFGEGADFDFNDVIFQVRPTFAAPIQVTIDIKPGSSPNSINPKSQGVIPVAILTTDAFDATTVDPLSVRFGPKGATEAHNQGHIEDVNHDGEPDLVLHFETQATGIQCGDTSASLTGETFEGDPIQGSDAIQTVGCTK
jgi:hypothetical protein